MPTKISLGAPWQERSTAKKNSVFDGVPFQFIHSVLEFRDDDASSVLDVPSRFLSQEELSITALNAVGIVRVIASKKYTCVQVLDAFTHRAAIAHRLLNCCLEFRYDAAHAEAISVKDQCRIIGTETTCGFIANVGVVDTENSVLVDILMRAGAVIFVKTNLSIGCSWGETIKK